MTTLHDDYQRNRLREDIIAALAAIDADDDTFAAIRIGNAVGSLQLWTANKARTRMLKICQKIDRDAAAEQGRDAA